MIYKKLIAFISLFLGGGGIICTTMHLTNTNNGLLNSLDTLNIEDRVEVKEDELQPRQEQQEQTPPPPASPPSSEESNSPDDTSDSSNPSDPPKTETSPTPESSASPVKSSGNSDPMAVIQHMVLEIMTKGENKWLNDTTALTNTYEISDRINRLREAISSLQSAASSVEPTPKE